MAAQRQRQQPLERPVEMLGPLVAAQRQRQQPLGGGPLVADPLEAFVWQTNGGGGFKLVEGGSTRTQGSSRASSSSSDSDKLTNQEASANTVGFDGSSGSAGFAGVA